MPVVLICHHQASVGCWLCPAWHLPFLSHTCGCSPAPATDAPVQPTLDSMAGERGWQWAHLAEQAPGQASSCHSGTYSSQQLVPRGVPHFPTRYPPSSGWGPTLLPAMPHRRISLRKCPVAKGTASALRGTCASGGGSHQDPRDF